MASGSLPLHPQRERGQVDATTLHETVHMNISGEAADPRSEKNFSERQAGTDVNLQHKDTGGDSELEHALAEFKHCSETLQSMDDVKAQTLNELVDQKTLLEEVKTQLENALASKNSAVKGSADISQSHPEADKVIGQEYNTRQDKVEATKKEDSTETSKRSPDLGKATQQKHCTGQDEVQVTKQEDSTEISQVQQPDSDKPVEKKHSTRQDEVEETKQEDSTEVSQILLDSDKAREQKHCTKQDVVEAMKKENCIETSLSLPVSDKAQDEKHYTRPDAIEAIKKEGSTAISCSPPDSVKNNTVQDKSEVEAAEKELTSVSEDLVLAKQEISKLQVEIRSFGEMKIDNLDSIQAAEKTAFLVLQKVLDLLKDRLEEKLVAANAALMETSSEEAISTSGQDSEHKSKDSAATNPKQDLESLIKDLAILQTSISQKKQTSFKMDEWTDTRGGPGEAKDNQSVPSGKIELKLSEAVADLQKAKVAEVLAVQNAGSKVDELEEVKFRLKKAAAENATLSATVESLRIRWNISKAELESILDREKTAAAVLAAIRDEIKKVKADAAAALAAEAMSKKIISALTTGLQEMSIEADKAKVSHKEAFEEARRAKVVASQAKAANVTRQYNLQAALKEAEAAKASEAITLEEIKYLSQPRTQNESDAETIGKEQYDSLRKKLEEAREQATQRLAEAMNSLKAEQGAQQELQKQLQDAMADIEASKLTKQQALQQAEAAEAGKVAAEGELRKWRAENRQRRAAADAASSVATPSPTYSGRLLTPETPEKTHHPKTDHFAQVYQLSLPPPAEKNVYRVNNNQIALKKMNMLTRIISFFSIKRRRAMA